MTNDVVQQSAYDQAYEAWDNNEPIPESLSRDVLEEVKEYAVAKNVALEFIRALDEAIHS